MPNAQIRFTQAAPGPGVGGNGLALIGVAGTAVLVENVDNTSVDKAQFEILYVPPGSSLTTGVKQAYSSTLTWSGFTPDSTECFVIRLRVKDTNGNESIDDRVFGVLETTGRLHPPVVRGSAMNFGGNASGWQPYQRAFNKMVDTLDLERRKAGVNVTDATQTLQPSAGLWRKILPATLTANRVITLGVVGATVDMQWEFLRRDVGNFTVTFVSGGGSGVILVLPATLMASARFRYDGVNWELRTVGTLPFVADANPTDLGILPVFPDRAIRPRMLAADQWFFSRVDAPPGIP